MEQSSGDLNYGHTEADIYGSRTYALEVGRMHWTYTNDYMYECRRLGLTPVSYLNYNVLI